jgi:hypothetical protein
MAASDALIGQTISHYRIITRAPADMKICISSVTVEAASLPGHLLRGETSKSWAATRILI